MNTTKPFQPQSRQGSRLELLYLNLSASRKTMVVSALEGRRLKLFAK